MAKVTSKLQVTIPKAIAVEYGIEPGDEIEFRPAGDSIRVVLPGRARSFTRLSKAERLRLFDESMVRQREREKGMRLPSKRPEARDWKREDLYTRGDS